MVSRSVLLITASALIAVAAPTTAGAVMLGPGSGVTAALGSGAITVTFTPAAVAAARLRTGATLEADCAKLPAAPGLAFVEDSAFVADDDESDDGEGLSAGGRLGADGVATLKVTTSGSGRPAVVGYDACELDLTTEDDDGNSDSTFPIAEIGLTPAGVAYADESERAVALRHALTAAHQAAGGYKPATAMPGVTPLAAPGDSVPAGTIGYWTDGRQALMTTSSAAGRRLLLADRGDLTVASNVFEQSDPFGASDIGDSDILDALFGVGSAAGTTTTPRKDPERDATAPEHLRSRNGLRPLPGLRAAVAGRRLSLRFTGAAARTYRLIAGRKIRATCLRALPRTLFPTLFSPAANPGDGLTGWTRVARHGGRVAITLHGARSTPDICLLNDDGITFATVAPTRAGRIRIQDVQALTLLSTIDRHLVFAARGATAYRPTAQVVAGDPKRLVALSGPDAAPPVGRVGVWTDGARRATLALRSASGARFAYTDEGDGVLATNVFSLYTADGIAFLATLGEDDN